jgi:hypothetical protein
MTDVQTVTARATGAAKETAIAFRRTVVDLLCGGAARTAISELGPDGTGTVFSLPLLSSEQSEYVLASLREQEGWAEEKWLILPDESVRLGSDEEFAEAPAEQRFSFNDCLRGLSADALPVRALISALESKEVAAAFSDAYGEPVAIRSVDMARYSQGHYLRRHSDTFDDRYFALVLFLADGWVPGAGGELLVESPGGEARVAYPEQGIAALMRINPGFHHQVSRLQSDSWVRYNLSVHFGRPKADSSGGSR